MPQSIPPCVFPSTTEIPQNGWFVVRKLVQMTGFRVENQSYQLKEEMWKDGPIGAIVQHTTS